jgi:uncharacterized protein
MILELLDKDYTVYKLSVKEEIDSKIIGNDFISITKTEDEISIVTVSGAIKYFEKKEENWKLFKISGILDFNLIGIISKISAILAAQEISIFVMSTYNTDYIMVKKDNLEKTIKVLEQNEYVIKKNKYFIKLEVNNNYCF